MSLIARVLGKRAGCETPNVRSRATAPQIESLETREMLSTFTVTNQSADLNVRGSLPWAVNQSNYTSRGLDYITFNIPGGGVHPIILNSSLYLNEQVVIDGTSQPGYNGSPLIYVQGSAATPSLFVLQNDPSQGTNSSGSTVQGLGMYAYTANAVTIFASSTGNFIQANWMGFYLDATNGNGPYLTTSTFASTFPAGVGIQSSFNTIRGNTISGVYNGIIMGVGTSPTATDYVTNSIQGNNIGTDPSGTTSVRYGNQSDGIFLGSGSRRNFLGPDNVLSGNASAGVELLHSTNTGNVIFRNKIGTDRSGNASIGNGELGVLLANGASGNAVGGPFGGNLISGNSLGGISLGTSSFGGSSANYVQYNIIGLNGGQSAPSGRQDIGIGIAFASNRNVIESNVVAGHVSHGIFMANSESNYLNGNYVGRNGVGVWIANGGYGIVLLSGASRNFILSTAYGSNRQGNLFVDRGAVGNDIR